METTAEGEAVTPCSRMDSKDPLLTDWKPQSEQIFIKQENLLTDGQPETEQIYIKEENIKLEAPEDHYGSDPLKEEPGEYVSEEETSYPTDEPYLYIKQDPECMLEEETTTPPGPTQIGTGLQESSCGSETESGVEENRSDDLPTGLGNPAQSTDNEKAPCDQSSARISHVLSCTICQKTFANLHDLNVHNDEKCCKFLPSCKLCGKVFIMPLSLKAHIHVVHAGEFPVRCEHCQKTFKNNQDVNSHWSVHRRNCHVCEVCHQTFKQRIFLKRHSLFHTGSDIGICDICQKPFKISSKVDTGNYPSVCQGCDKRATRSRQPKQYSSRRGRTSLPP